MNATEEEVLDLFQESGEAFVHPGNSYWGPTVLRMISQGKLIQTRPRKGSPDADIECLTIRRNPEWREVEPTRPIKTIRMRRPETEGSW